MNHLMIDIETLGNKSFSVITSVAAVQFDIETGKTGEEFYERINIDNSLKNGLNVDGDTLRWWFKQSKEAQKEFSDYDGVNVTEFCDKFDRFFLESILTETKIWGNSNRFDLGLLDNMYESVGRSYPWNFRHERDVRTIVSFAPEIKANCVFNGVPHNAVDDCKYQIEYVSKIWNILNHKK